MHSIKKRPTRDSSWSLGGANGSMVDLSYCKSRVRIIGFGRYYKGHEVDWSFRPFKQPRDGKLDPVSTRLLPEVAASLGIKEMLAPHPTFGTDMCAINDLRVRIPMTHGDKRVVLVRGKQADSMAIAPGETFAISVGGCPIGWMFDLQKPDKLLVAHMGLKCLIDRSLAVTGQKSRHHRSVIDRMWESMRLLPGEASRVHAGFAFPIYPLENKHEWDYAGDGHENKLICKHLVTEWGTDCVYGWADEQARKLGRIHLGNVIRGQYKACGILSENIHGVSAPDAVGADGHPLWYVTRGPHGKDPRNLVLVQLRA